MNSSQRGFMLVEVLVGMGIMAVVLSAFAALTIQSQQVARASSRDLSAILAGKETLEAVEDLSQTDWLALSACAPPIPCHAEVAGGRWTLVMGEQNAHNVTRSLLIYPVYRDTLAFPNNIVPVAGVLDPNTKRASVALSWFNGVVARDATIEAYVYKMP